MAKPRRDTISGLINSIRGQFVPKEQPTPVVLKQRRVLEMETMSDALAKGTKIAQGTGSSNRMQNLLGSSALGQQLFLDAAERKLENQMIMQMFPDLERNARYMIASCFSPVDLNVTKIPVAVKAPGLTSVKRSSLQDKLTDLIEKKLELSVILPDLAYESGFISGGELMITIPRLSLTKSFSSIVSTEALTSVLDELPTVAFSSKGKPESSFSMESFSEKVPEFKQVYAPFAEKLKGGSPTVLGAVATFFQKAVSTESLKISDNLSMLSYQEAVSSRNDEIRMKATSDLARMRVSAKAEPVGILKAPSEIGGSDTPEVMGDPLTIRVSAESAFFIFPPGAPDKPTAAVLVLDETGSPINVASYGGASPMSANVINSASQSSMFRDVGQATTSTNNTDYMRIEGVRQLQDLYRTFMSNYVLEKVKDAGYGTIDIGDTDAIMKSMFYRYLERRTTRLLIIPRQFFTYFTFDVGQDGIGRTKIEGIKKYLVMKMVVLVSKVLAAMRAASDTRKITVNLDTPAMVPEDVIVENTINGYVQKNLLNFDSLNLQGIQSRIIANALQIDIKNAQGQTQGSFDITNESVTQGKTVDFDPDLLHYLDQQINNKVPVPASLTSSLDEPELATTITTANLFYTMAVSMDQRVLNKSGSQWVRQYSRESEEVREIIRSVLDEKKEGTQSGDAGSLSAEKSSNGVTIDEIIESLEIVLPKPIISKNRAQFDSLTAMMDAVGKLVDVIYPDSLYASDQNAQNALAAIKAAAIKETVTSLAAESGITQMGVTSDNLLKTWDAVLTTRQEMKNVVNSVKMMDAATEGKTNAPSDGSTDDNSGEDYTQAPQGYI